jgi:DNA repair protein RecO (recombination protein O)
MPARTTEGIILRVKPYQESDLIVDFFAAASGRITGIAKGAKNSKRRFVHCLEPLCRVRLTFFEKPSASLVRIDQGELIRAFEGIRSDFRKWGKAGFFCELVRELFPVQDPNPAVFRLLNETLETLENETRTDDLAVIFQLRLLALAGYGFHLNGCLTCRKTITGMTQPAFSLERGGILCQDCLRGETLPLSPGTVQSMRQIMVKDLEKAFRIRLSTAMRREVEAVLDLFIKQTLGKELGSVRYLRQMQEAYG